jgi:cytochrome c553
MLCFAYVRLSLNSNMYKWLLIFFLNLSGLPAYAEDRDPSLPLPQDLIAINDPLHPVITVCASCHGVDGAAKDNPSIPVIAAQYPRYLEQQLHAFALGEQGPRPNALMEPIAKDLSEEQTVAISQYYGGLKKQWLDTPFRPDLEKGRRLYLGGAFDKKIPACSSCHSPTGFGNEPANYPSLSGQHAEYLITQLQNYRSKARLHNIMNTVAQNLSDEEIEAVAYYLQGLRSKNFS